MNCVLPLAFVLLLTVTQGYPNSGKITIVNDLLDEDAPFAEPEEGKHWALIVAGSNGYFNYRHQADACHSYQIMKKNGIPDERIVVMMYDDIAYSEENPLPGKIINRPNGPDVYHGVPKDYTKDDVTPKNFLNILQGNEVAMQGIGSGKVIKSGPNDHVFVNFADHGAPGLIAFPTDELKASDLISAIKSMYSAKKYKQMVFYIEACESGSMFKNLPDDVNVYATTAANGKESSYACYYDDELKTYLGDVYSVKWMEDSDKENLNVETLHKQYEIVKQETNTSHVQQFGSMDISQEHLSEFQSGGPEFVSKAKPIKYPHVPLDPVKVDDVRVAILTRRLMTENDPAMRMRLSKQLDSEVKMREHVRDVMKRIAGVATHTHEDASAVLYLRQDLSRYDCYEPSIKYFKENCFNYIQNEYVLRHLYVLANLCEKRVPTGVIVEAMQKVCT